MEGGGGASALKRFQQRRAPQRTSSSFLPVKMSMATRWTLAWPCLPVLEVDMSTIWCLFVHRVSAHRKEHANLCGLPTHLAGTVLDDDVTVLSESRALRREGQRGASVGGLAERERYIGQSDCACGLLHAFSFPRVFSPPSRPGSTTVVEAAGKGELRCNSLESRGL